MADNKILYEIEIKGTTEELKNLADINSQIEQLKAKLKDKDKLDKSTAEQAKLTLKEQQSAYRDLQKSIDNRNKAERQSADTLESLRAKLANYNRELKKIPLGTKDWDAQAKKINEVKDKIREADAQVGNFQSNVGNYKNDIVSAFQQMGINVQGLNNQLSSASKLFSTTIPAAAGKTTGALKLLRLALISTGVGAIVVVLGSIVAYLTSTQAGLDKINKILIPLGNTLQRVLGIAQELGGAFVRIISGEAKEGWNDLKNTVAGIGDELSEAWQQGKRLYDISIELRNLSLAIAANEGRINLEIAKQRAILDDVTKSDQERRKAGEQAIALQNALTQLKQQENEKQLEQARIKAAQNDTDIEAQKELAQLAQNTLQIEADAENKKREIQNKLNALKKAENDRERAAIIERTKLQELEYELLLNSIAAVKDAAVSLRGEDPENAVFKLFDEEEINDLPEFINSLIELQQSELEAAKATTAGLNNEYSERLKILEAFLKQGLITEEQYTLRRRELQMDLMDASIAALKGVAVEGSKIQQGLFLFEKLLAVKRAFLAITQGTAETAKVGFPQNIPLLIGFAAQVAGLISAIKSVSAPTPPKFAKGVIGLQGAGTGTSDSIDAKLSRGESVMTAKATAAFAPVMADMERAVGNTPNFQIGAGRFASGFIGAQPKPKTDFPQSYASMIEQTVRAIGQIPVIVSEGDITATQNRVRKIRVSGDL